MNDSCSANGTSSALIASLTSARDTLNTYPFRIVSGVGVIFNYYTLYALNHSRLRFKFHDFLICRCCCNLVVCLLGIFYNQDVNPLWLCNECKIDYWLLFLQAYLVQISIRAALMASAISDILLINNRIALLFNKKESRFYTLSKKVSILLFNLKSN